MEVGGHRKIGRPKLRWSDVTRKDMLGGETSIGLLKDKRSTRPENMEIAHASQARMHAG